ncbi:MAG: hypothetical protein ACFFC7_20540 [Candidatus Hermodarchaeota archaeon]
MESIRQIPNFFKRIAIYGAPGSGKSTLAIQLGKILRTRVIHLDDIYHGPFWREPSKKIFQARVIKLIKNPLWIIDGNYSSVRPLILSRATLAIILDLPMYLLAWRIFIRTISRNTRIKLGSTTPLPYQVQKSGAKEQIPVSIFELWSYALDFRNKKYYEIRAEVENSLGFNKVIVLRKKQKIVYFLNIVQNCVRN